MPQHRAVDHCQGNLNSKNSRILFQTSLCSMSMSEGRHREAFMTGLALSRLGLSQDEVATELYAVVGPEPHLRKKVPGVVKSLKKYARL